MSQHHPSDACVSQKEEAPELSAKAVDQTCAKLVTERCNRYNWSYLIKKITVDSYLLRLLLVIRKLFECNSSKDSVRENLVGEVA